MLFILYITPQYLKLDEMLEKEANLRNALRNRAGVMGLMLNSTFDHDLSEQIMQMEQEKNYQEQLRQTTKS